MKRVKKICILLDIMHVAEDMWQTEKIHRKIMNDVVQRYWIDKNCAIKQIILLQLELSILWIVTNNIKVKCVKKEFI